MLSKVPNNLGRSARELTGTDELGKRRVAHVAGYAQSLRGAYTEATGNGLDASANRLTERSLMGAKGTGPACPSLLL